MRTSRYSTALGLCFTVLTGLTAASVVAQTRHGTRSPSTVAAGAFATAVVFEGGEIFVGRPGEFYFFPIPANHAGTVHVFGPDEAGDWVETAVLTSAAVEIGDGFGAALAVDGNVLMVGAPKIRGEKPAAAGST